MTENLIKLAAMRDAEVVEWARHIQAFAAAYRNDFNFLQGFKAGHYANNVQECARYIRESKFDDPHLHAMMHVLAQIEAELPDMVRYCWREYKETRSHPATVRVL